MPTPIEVLLQARTLLQDGWTQGTFARDMHGRPCPTLSEHARQFDLAGAIVRAAGGLNRLYERTVFVLQEGMDVSLTYWQDSVTHADVLACLDESIATLRSREEGYAFD